MNYKYIDINILDFTFSLTYGIKNRIYYLTTKQVIILWAKYMSDQMAIC